MEGKILSVLWSAGYRGSNISNFIEISKSLKMFFFLQLQTALAKKKSLVTHDFFFTFEIYRVITSIVEHLRKI